VSSPEVVADNTTLPWAGIGKHTETLKSLLEEAGGRTSPDHCRGMQGLITEVAKHAVDEGRLDPQMREPPLTKADFITSAASRWQNEAMAQP
jgi:hypothetical protein